MIDWVAKVWLEAYKLQVQWCSQHICYSNSLEMVTEGWAEDEQQPTFSLQVFIINDPNQLQ